MVRQKPGNNNDKLNKKRRCSILKGAALLIMLAGICLITVNLYHFTRSAYAEANYAAKFSSAAEQSQLELFGSTEEITSSATTTPTPLTRSTRTALYDKQPGAGDLFGELSIPKINAVYPIYEGTDENELDLGVGHYTDSVLPGENDNCVLSGHRNTVFKELGEVKEGDSLIVATSAGTFEYVVQKVRIVDKDDRTVIVPKPQATLTISTCYPFVYTGSAPQRYILVAYLKSTAAY